MIDVRNEIQYIIVSNLLSGMAEEGFLTADELATAPPLSGMIKQQTVGISWISLNMKH